MTTTKLTVTRALGYPHAFDRMAEREISVLQMKETLTTPTQCRVNKKQSSSRQSGRVYDFETTYRDGWTLRVIAELANTVAYVITAYWVGGVDGKKVRRS